MPEVYVLVNTVPNKLWEVAESALNIGGVKTAHAVTGQFDVVVYAEIAEMSRLKELIDKIHSLDGVLRTNTVIAIPKRIVD